jgi:hypothetical protein
MQHLDLVVFACVGLAACGGPTFEDGIYADAHTRYQVGTLPGRWQSIDANGNDLAFYREGMGTVAVNSTCTEYDDVPLTALVKHLLFDTTARDVRLDETVTLVNRGARHLVVELELDGVPVELELFVLRKDGCIYDLVHVRARSAPAPAREAFLAFVARFEVLGRPQ